MNVMSTQVDVNIPVKTAKAVSNVRVFLDINLTLMIEHVEVNTLYIVKLKKSFLILSSLKPHDLAAD